MKNILIIIRSIIYNIFCVIWTIFIGIICSPFLILPKDNNLVKIAAKIWTKGLYLSLDFICNIKYEVKGQENIPTKPYIIAAKHQSALDIIMLISLLDSPKFIMKDSLLFVPVIGLYGYKMGMIHIDRSGGSKTLKSMLLKSKKVIQNNESVLIFPEGTRTKPGQISKYHSGIVALYKACNTKVLPVALNTGLFWKKSAFIKMPGKFTIEFLPVIEPGLDKKDFIEILEEKIEITSKKLVDNIKVN